MHVLVMGAGVIGVTSAYYLLKAGHKVTVVDRQPGPGMETSFANGGQISVGHAEPWANPATPWLMLRWLGRRDAPLLVRLRFDPALWAWGLRFLANCTTRRTRENLEKNLRLGALSRDSLIALRGETGLDYDQQANGILQIFRTRNALDEAARKATELHALGLGSRVLTADECVELEPALSPSRGELVGGLITDTDESGDAHLFTECLAEHCAGMGAEFKYGVHIKRLVTGNGQVSGVVTDGGTLTADAYVMALAAYGPKLLRPHGSRLPVYPAKGYSVTIPTAGYNGAPAISITDQDHKIVYSRLGDRLRVAGTAEFTGFDTVIDERRIAAILKSARHQFPAAGNFDAAEPWAGLRPLTPDGVPVIGSTKFSNLYLNTGHGTLGWTLACGSSRLLADIMSGTAPPIDPAGYALKRFDQ